MESGARKGTGRRIARTVIETAAWTLLLVGVWLATLTAVTGSEVVIAVIVALALAPVALASRRTLGVVVRPRAAWARWLVRVPAAVVADSAQLAVAVVRAARGDRTIGADRELTLPAEDVPRARTRVALAALVVSCTPGSYVADARPATANAPGTLVVHALRPRPSGLERAVTR